MIDCAILAFGNFLNGAIHHLKKASVCLSLKHEFRGTCQKMHATYRHSLSFKKNERIIGAVEQE